jgi:hypothetical protein
MGDNALALVGIGVGVAQLLLAWFAWRHPIQSTPEDGTTTSGQPRLRARRIAPVVLLTSASIFILIGLVAFVLRQSQRTSPTNASSATVAGPSSSAPTPLPGKSFPLYDVNSNSAQSAYTVQVDANGWIEQALSFKPDVEILELGVIVGYNPQEAIPHGPLLIELLEDGTPRIQQTILIDDHNNARSSIFPRPPFPLHEGRSYTLRVTNQTKERMGYWVKPTRSKLTTSVRGSLSGPDGPLPNVDLSAFVLARER